MSELHDAAELPPIRYERYGGYLRHWAREIVILHLDGMELQQIADTVTPAVQAKFANGPFQGTTPSSAMIDYVLRRVGAKAPTPTQCRKWAAGLNCPAPSPAATPVVESKPTTGSDWRRLEAEREARWNRIVDGWLAERANRRLQAFLEQQHQAREAIRLLNKGRPLDMGGPRDQWIEADPWSAL